jgi:thiamine biosynthesis protein ThiI
MERVVVVHYHEIALKGRNRPLFIGRLARNIRSALRDLPVGRIFDDLGRLVVPISDENFLQEALERLSKVFGIANYSPAWRLPRDYAALQEAVSLLMATLPPFSSFRVDAHRTDKSFPMRSEEINRVLGAYIKERTGSRVQLKGAEVTFYVEVLPRALYLYTQKLPGAGGLPVGVSGRVVSLLSGGIDSPVAAYRIMRRGCEVVFVHFHSFPFLSDVSIRKTRDLVALLNRYQLRSRLYVVPIGELQQQVVALAPAAYRVIIYRRFMVRIAEQIALREKARALVTGESLGQVASQTLENLATIESAVDIPVLRPLIGMDKQEITDQARAIGTFEISILPDQDCCTLFMPRQPATRSTPQQAAEAETALDVPGLVAAALERAEVVDFEGTQPAQVTYGQPALPKGGQTPWER